MDIKKQKATYYFQSYTNYFWQWETDYMFNSDEIENAYDFTGSINCINIPDGMTIAYKEQLHEVLEALSETGFPPFGSLVLAFLATNSGEVKLAVDKIFDNFHKQYIDFDKVTHINFAGAHAFLNTLISLPNQFKKGKNRIELFMFLFKDVNYNLSNKYSETILIWIRNKAYELHKSSKKTDSSIAIVSKEINALALLHKKYPNIDKLLEAWGKVVPVAIEPEDTEITSVSEEPDLIQELIEDPKTFLMGNLIKQIWSGIQLPMHYAHPGQMPLGGISDITNKGKFDNLLISEFANDDLTFLHRIANKEALFIRRETTPEEDLRTRVFLIDTTIKNWGTPKIIAFATVFALIHHPKNEMYFQPYAVGETYTKLQLHDKGNIIEGLQVTSPLLDASIAIQQFIDECKDENIEITLFTSPKTLQHAGIQRIFNQHHDKFGGIITADTIGNIEVYKLKNGAKRLVKHIQLPLKKLWSKPPRASNRSIQKASKLIPIIEYPLLYGYPNGYLTHFFEVADGYVLQKRGFLYKMDSPSHGFKLVRNDLNFVKGIKNPLVAALFNGELIVLTWNSLNGIVIRTEHETHTFEEYVSDQSFAAIKNLVVHNGELYFISKKYYSADPVYLKIDITHKLIDEITTPSNELKEEYDLCLSNYFGYFTGSVFSKIKSVAITKNLEFIFNNLHKLRLEDDYLLFELDRSQQVFTSVAEYVDKTEFMFVNESKVIIDKKGILTFSSPNPSVETFYLTSYIEFTIALATEKEFAGNSYFLPEKSSLKEISVKDFKRKHIDPFIVNILNS